jgi:hypothetical protein
LVEISSNGSPASSEVGRGIAVVDSGGSAATVTARRRRRRRRPDISLSVSPLVSQWASPNWAERHRHSPHFSLSRAFMNNHL